jgi:eukaryotic-like serine/threonine-protein kinase
MEPLVKTGTVVGGRYRAVRLAWPSAAGPVWNAKDTVLDRDVLLFTLAPDVASDAHAREALLSAAARSASLIDGHIAQVYDCSTDPPYLVSEMPAGGRLAERIADKPVPLRDAARIVVGLAHALTLLHEHGIAHGAVGPGWTGTDEEGRAKLLGAGLVDVANIAAAIRGGTMEPALLPPGYPEPGTDAAAADVRCLATLAFHMLTGKPPDAAGASLVKAKVPAPVATAIERAMRGESDLRALTHAFTSHAAPPAPVEREPGFLRTEGRWLAGVLLAVGVAVGLAIASLAIVKSNSTKAPSTKPSIAPSALALKIQSARDFDPPPGNGSEHPDQVRLAFDADPVSAWFTVGYASAKFGGGKTGVGLLFDLGAPGRVAAVRIRATIVGWQGELRAADSEGESPNDYRTVGTFTQASDTTVTLTQPVQSRYWLLWITRLTDTQDGSNIPFKAAVSDVQFLPT